MTPQKISGAGDDERWVEMWIRKIAFTGQSAGAASHTRPVLRLANSRVRTHQEMAAQAYVGNEIGTDSSVSARLASTAVTAKMI